MKTTSAAIFVYSYGANGLSTIAVELLFVNTHMLKGSKITPQAILSAAIS